jgi:hypothetical protein
MLKKQNGFAGLELLLILFVIIGVACAGYFVYHSKQSNSESSESSVSTQSTKTITQHEAFALLNRAYANKVATSQKECPSYDQDCLANSLAGMDKLAVAKAYGVTDNLKDTIYFGLQKGKSLDIGGIGAGYLDNKSKLDISDSAWYWEIGACSTNNRIFIDASTGATTGIHSWTYCSHNIDELSAPN